MKLSVNRIIVSLVFSLVTLGLSAQEKTLQYYNTHENEILPDARTAFRTGDYDRTLELCRWHYIIFGDNSTVESLREKSERCAVLSKEMNAFRSEGNVKEAKQKATVILSINPDDVAAKEVLSIEDSAPALPDTLVVDPPVKRDTVVIPPPTRGQNYDNPGTGGNQHSLGDVPSVPGTNRRGQGHLSEPRNRFVVKAGATIVDLKQFSQTIAPGASIGVYDLGGSPIGGEMGVYICPGLSSVSASLFGADASLVFRAAENVYPKLGVGFFSCKSSETNTSTKGMCAGGGLTYMVGGHFCLEVGVKYYPKVCVQGTERVSTTPGASYEFQSDIQIISGGIAPFVSVGWAF
jgi:hypothetical protein